MINELTKRECDITVTLYPSGTQFLCIEMDIQGDHHKFLASSAVGGQFGEFISALYSLFQEGYDAHGEWHNTKTVSDDNHIIHSVRTVVEWDEEGDVIEFIMSRNITMKIECQTDMLDIEIRRNWKHVVSYTVKTTDFCYAVAKACTQALKKYGFYGYRISTEHDCFNIYQLLYIKAFALGDFEARELLYDQNKFVQYSSFDKEIRLLLFDM